MSKTLVPIAGTDPTNTSVSVFKQLERFGKVSKRLVILTASILLSFCNFFSFYRDEGLTVALFFFSLCYIFILQLYLY